jgi:hypothetical protein
MWDLFTGSLRLFIKGKLFRDPRQVARQWLIGVTVTFVAMMTLAQFGAPLWLAVVLASFGGGALQPLLFKNLKYN